MENDLSRSVRLLEDSLKVQGTSLLRRNVAKFRKSPSTNLSITLNPDELLYIQGDITKLNDYTVGNTTFFQSAITGNETLTGTVIRTKEPWKNAFELLYTEFSEVLQTHSGTQDVLETVSDLRRCCSDALNVVQGLKSKITVRYQDPEEEWLENERNTWQLIYVLYHDRLASEYLREQNSDTAQYFGLSEKLCMLNLFKRENLVRESQLVIDWLENNTKLNDDETLLFSDNTVGWENTLHQLQSKETIVFASSREIVKSLHPDAPVFENRPLHDLDEADDKKLCQKVFREIRCGNLENAQKLCVNSGHAWRAALFEGWRLFHDPNREMNTSEDIEAASLKSVEKMEGNKNRDLWKQMAFKYCNNEKLNRYIRSSIAVYCGYLKEVLPVCRTWEDYLWAYLKVMIDIKVESEIRDCVNRTYKSLPDFYWDQRMSLNEIFAQLESSECKLVQEQSKKPEHIIQKYLILDDIGQLFVELEEFLNEEVSTHFLRFLSHLVLFLEQIGQSLKRSIAENILEMYIKRLMDMDDVQLVAFYTSKLGGQKQVDLYSTYLEGITEDEDRRNALKCAEECGLNVSQITKTVVENIRNKPFELSDLSLPQKLTPGDEYKISAIDWLLFIESDRLEAIIQSNALINKFLSLKKLDAALLVFNKIPSDVSENLLSENPSTETQSALREHLGYRAYLDAQEAFSLWFKHFNMRPMEPASINEDAYLTEKVAHEHRMSQYKSEIERWKMTLSHLAKSSKTLLYNVLLFPDGGWLVGTRNSEHLRLTCIPECVLLLYNVLFESGLHSECIRLADILASEKYGLYKAYNANTLREIIRKLADVSVALLNSKQDPWGNDGLN